MMRRCIAVVAVLPGLFLSQSVRADGPVSEANVVYAKRGDVALHLEFVRPAGDGPFPLMLLVHGGGWRGGSRASFAGTQVGFASMGVASAAVEYRFAPQHVFPAQQDDVLSAVRFLAAERERFHIDPDRVGLLGGSAGGHLALLAGFAKGDGYRIRAVVNMAGPTDLRTFASTAKGDAALKAAMKRDSSDLLEDLLGTRDRLAKVYADASPVAHIRQDGPVVLTLHGSDDDIVPVSQAEALHAALKAAGVRERLIAIAGGGHDFGQWPEKERNAAHVAMFDFIKRELKPGE